MHFLRALDKSCFNFFQLTFTDCFFLVFIFSPLPLFFSFFLLFLPQELDRYNRLLRSVRGSLGNIGKAILGLVAVTPDLEEVMESLTKLRVPKTWSKTYPSLKPLGSWFTDLIARCEQFRTWSETDLPKFFWLSGFTYPTGMLTAVLQTR